MWLKISRLNQEYYSQYAVDHKKNIKRTKIYLFIEYTELDSIYVLRSQAGIYTVYNFLSKYSSI